MASFKNDKKLYMCFVERNKIINAIVVIFYDCKNDFCQLKLSMKLNSSKRKIAVYKNNADCH